MLKIGIIGVGTVGQSVVNILIFKITIISVFEFRCIWFKSSIYRSKYKIKKLKLNVKSN